MIRWLALPCSAPGTALLTRWSAPLIAQIAENHSAPVIKANPDLYWRLTHVHTPIVPHSRISSEAIAMSGKAKAPEPTPKRAASRSKRVESYSSYIFKVLKQVHPDTGISKKSMVRRSHILCPCLCTRVAFIHASSRVIPTRAVRAAPSFSPLLSTHSFAALTRLSKRSTTSPQAAQTLACAYLALSILYALLTRLVCCFVLVCSRS